MNDAVDWQLEAHDLMAECDKLRADLDGAMARIAEYEATERTCLARHVDEDGTTFYCVREKGHPPYHQAEDGRGWGCDHA